jgi:hypothetical protein
MPKLPVDFVKAPGFDNPLRSTAANDTLSQRKLMLRLDEATWEALLAACERESRTPEAVVRRALERYFSEPEAVAMTPREPSAPRPSLRAQLFEQLREQFVKRSWVQCVLTMRAILREARA